MEVLSFRDLIIWQRAIELCKEVYRLSQRFPTDERFGLTLQIRRAAVSVSSNIAEGHARQGKEFRHFLSIARGSLAEVESQLALAVELGYIRNSDLNVISSQAREIRKTGSALSQKLSAFDKRPRT
jgi:four helix bundle protein